LLIPVGCRDTATESDGGAGATVLVNGTLVDYYTSLELEGAEVCALEDGKKSANCTTTDANGAYSIKLRPRTETGIFIAKVGHEAWLFPLWLTTHTTLRVLGLDADARALQNYSTAGATYPPVQKGHLWINGEPGATVSALPEAGVGPVYFGTSATVDMTTQAMMAPAPVAGLLDVTPGQYDVEVVLTGKSCTVADHMGWPSSKTLKAPVLDGLSTGTAVQCN